MIEELKEKYLQRLDQLSSRARFVLASTRLDRFENYYNFFVERDQMIDFLKLNNCGLKTEKELKGLAEMAIEYKEKYFPQQTFSLTHSNQTVVAFDNLFDSLSVRAKNVLIVFGAGHISGFIQKTVRDLAVFSPQFINLLILKSILLLITHWIFFVEGTIGQDP